MSVVRRIFSDVAGGKGLRTIKAELDSEHVPPPGRGKAWSRPFLRSLILDDLYKPHTIDELRELRISDDVLNRLDENEVYGVYRYQDVPVPIPDAGIPSETIEAARYVVRNNISTPKNGSRVWQLSGGFLFCSQCGRRMQPNAFRRKGHAYYRCISVTNGKADECINRTSIPAAELETQVWEAVRRTMDNKEYMLRTVREHFDAERKQLSRFGADDVALSRRVSDLGRRREGYWQLAADGDMPKEIMRKKVAEVEQELRQVEELLEKAHNREAELQRLDEAERQIRQRIEAGYGDLDNKSPQERRKVYQDLHVRVKVGADKQPQIWGIFRTIRLPRREGMDGQHTIYVVRADTSSVRAAQTNNTEIGFSISFLEHALEPKVRLIVR